jgi:hypothetical protein
LEYEGQLHNATLNKLQRQRWIETGALKQKAGFRNNSLTAQQKRLKKPKLFNSSLMMGIVTSQ